MRERLDIAGDQRVAIDVVAAGQLGAADRGRDDLLGVTARIADDRAAGSAGGGAVDGRQRLQVKAGGVEDGEIGVRIEEDDAWREVAPFGVSTSTLLEPATTWALVTR